MKRISYLILTFCILFLFNNCAQAQVFSHGAEKNTGTAVLPRGTLIKATLTETISSKENKVGDPVILITVADMFVGRVICIPKESIFKGKVVLREQATQGRDGYFQVLINEVIFPDGWRTNLVARLWTKDGSGTIGGGLAFKKEYKKIPHHIEHIGSVVQLVQTGASAMGRDRALLAGNNMLIVLEENLQVQYLQELD